MYHILYKTTHLETGRFYIGVHSTKKLEDGYLGSGILIMNAIKKYGKDKFKREVLVECNTAEFAYDLERDMVNEEFIQRNDTFNISIGGINRLGEYKDTCVLKDNDGNIFRTSVSDPKYISGELVGSMKGTVTVKDVNGNNFRVSLDDPRYISGELVGVAKGTATVKDKDGNFSRVNKNDPRYISGELVGVTKGCEVTDEFRDTISKRFKGKKKPDSAKKKMSNYAKVRVWIVRDGKLSHCWPKNLEQKLNEGWQKRITK